MSKATENSNVTSSHGSVISDSALLEETPPPSECSLTDDDVDDEDQKVTLPPILLQAPEKEQKMIAYACSVYQSLQTERVAAEESHRRLLSEAQDQHRIAKAKGSKAKSVKRHADRLISLALEGMFASRGSSCGSDLQLFDTNMKQVVSR